MHASQCAWGCRTTIRHCIVAHPVANAQRSRSARHLGEALPAKQTNAIKPYTTHAWQWRDSKTDAVHKINYVVGGCGQPVLLVHGFGASAGHFKRNIAVLSKQYKVYAVDLLGFGGSDKPALQYSMDLWRDQILAFCKEFIDAPVVLVGNSLGSLICLMVNAELSSGASSPPSAGVRGTVLLNTAGAMNNKGVLSDWRIVLAYPLFLLVDLLLAIPPVANWLFNNFRQRETLRKVLSAVYRNADAVDDELVDLIHLPSNDPGALAVFISVLTGPSGPKPWDLAEQIKGPLLVLWGDKDTLTPADGPVGVFFKNLALKRPETRFLFLTDVGHCPHDDRPELVHEVLLPWLAALKLPQPARSTESAAAGGVMRVGDSDTPESVAGQCDAPESVAGQCDTPESVAGQ